MKRNLLITLALLPAIFTTLIWIAGETDVMSRFGPLHLAGRWSCRTCQGWPGAITLLLYHDSPVAKVGPPFPPDMKYTPPVLEWYNKTIPPDVYHGSLGFAWNDEPHMEINRTNSWVLLGQQIELRLPDWVAIMLWLPLIVSILKWQNRRKAIHRGLCITCGYDLLRLAQALPRMRVDRRFPKIDEIKNRDGDGFTNQKHINYQGKSDILLFLKSWNANYVDMACADFLHKISRKCDQI